MGQVYDAAKVRRRLKDLAYKLRQEVVRDGDLETWRISRMIRQVSTAEQVKETESRIHRLRRWT